MMFVLVVAVITLWPGPPDPDGQLGLKQFLNAAHLQGLPLWITFGKVEFVANIALFVPIGLFGGLVLSRARWLIVPLAVAASAAIEVTQAMALPVRDGTPRDVLSNGLGAALGYLLASGVLNEVRRHQWLRTIPLARAVNADRARAQPARAQG